MARAIQLVGLEVGRTAIGRVNVDGQAAQGPYPGRLDPFKVRNDWYQTFQNHHLRCHSLLSLR